MGATESASTNTPANTPASEDKRNPGTICLVDKSLLTDDMYAGWPQIAYLPANVFAVLADIHQIGTRDNVRMHDGRILWTSPAYRAWLRRLRMAVARACLGIAEYEHAYGNPDVYRRKPLPTRPRDDYTSVQMYVLLQLWEQLLVPNVSWACFIAVRNDSLLRGMYGFVDAMVRCNEACIREMRRCVNAHGRLAYADVGDDEVAVADAPAMYACGHDCIRRSRVWT